MTGPAVRVVGLDHVVLNVADAEAALRFYCGVLGLEPLRVDDWRAGRVPFPSARIDATTIIDLLPAGPAGPGAANCDHICLVVAPTDLTALAGDPRLDVVHGPGTRFGAQGQGTSLYVRDPDGNTVELRHYG